LLNNIFLFIGKNLQDLEQLNIYNYPNDVITIQDSNRISRIINSFNHGDSSQSTISDPQLSSEKTKDDDDNPQLHSIDTPIPLTINGSNMYISCIDGTIIIGLVFDKEDNPYDYKEIFEETLNELLNIEKSCSFEDEIEIENFLISIFIDIRRFGDEFVEKRLEMEYHYQESYVKVFLFGIDDVGKSSLVRRIKTGKFHDNFFMPTKKFNIDYIQAEEKGYLAFWDMPGQSSFRKKWLIGLQDSNIIIYMIDVANQARFEESKKEFWKIINRYDLVGTPLIILANKVDLLHYSKENAHEQFNKLEQELTSYFEFNRIKNREWKLFFTSVKTNLNINETMNYILDLI
jgi:small GTP-binding protein